jgi:TRAP-type C4-dicarboxylate transport system permease small subunit
MGRLDRLIARVWSLSRYGVWFGGALILLAAVIIGIEVVIRKLFNVTIGGADELSGFALAISSAWALGFALLERAHVRIDSLYTALPAPVCAFLDILGLTVFTVLMSLLTWQALGVFQASVEMGSRTMTVLETPLMVPQFFWLLGLASFVIIAALLLLRALVTVAGGHFQQVQMQIGSRTVRQDLDEELGQIRQARDRAQPADDGSPGSPGP